MSPTSILATLLFLGLLGAPRSSAALGPPGSGPALVQQQPLQDPLLRPDPALQGLIRRMLSAQNAGEQRAALEALRASAGPEHEPLVRQLFLFSHQATDTREAMLLGFVLDQLDVPSAHVIAALLPLLESGDAALRQAIGRVLSEYEHISVERGADFSVYRPLLEQGPSLGLARHLFETDPDAAFLALLRAQVTDLAELRPLLWAQHEVADALWKLRFGFLARDDVARAAPEAMEQLDLLARHPRWWARVYAARIGSEEPSLAVRRDQLRQDEHALVRELASPR